MLLISYDKFQEYSNVHFLIAIGILGVAFIALGWIISRLFRPNGRVLQKELQEMKKELLAELNTAKKFNAKYQHLVDEGPEEAKETPEEKES